MEDSPAFPIPAKSADDDNVRILHIGEQIKVTVVILGTVTSQALILGLALPVDDDLLVILNIHRHSRLLSCSGFSGIL